MPDNKNALAIAFSVKRNAKKRKLVPGQEEDGKVAKPATKPGYASPAMSEYMEGKFAEGGEINKAVPKADAEASPMGHAAKAAYHMEQAEKYQRLADGGMINEAEDMEDAESDMAPSDAIMARRRKMADGGQVDLEANSEESDADHGAKYNQAANLKEQYDDSQISEQPEDSNETGDSAEMDSENEDDASLVSAIRKRLKAKRA